MTCPSAREAWIPAESPLLVASSPADSDGVEGWMLYHSYMALVERLWYHQQSASGVNDTALGNQRTASSGNNAQVLALCHVKAQVPVAVSEKSMPVLVLPDKLAHACATVHVPNHVS